MSSLSALIILFAAACLAQIVPTAPGPGQTFRAGDSCAMEWHPDTTGTWNSLTIALMSGSNENMTLVKNVASGVDGTVLSSYAWICPEVDPYSAIYFYQFSQVHQNVTNNTWTTRFTIASVNGTSILPEHSTQPDGEVIPWGFGRLLPVDVQDSLFTIPIPPPRATAANIPSMIPLAAPISAMSSPEMTLNIPSTRSEEHARRISFSRVCGSRSSAKFSPPRVASTSPECES